MKGGVALQGVYYVSDHLHYFAKGEDSTIMI